MFYLGQAGLGIFEVCDKLWCVIYDQLAQFKVQQCIRQSLCIIQTYAPAFNVSVRENVAQRAIHNFLKKKMRKAHSISNTECSI